MSVFRSAEFPDKTTEKKNTKKIILILYFEKNAGLLLYFELVLNCYTKMFKLSCTRDLKINSYITLFQVHIFHFKKRALGLSGGHQTLLVRKFCPDFVLLAPYSWYIPDVISVIKCTNFADDLIRILRNQIGFYIF